MSNFDEKFPIYPADVEARLEIIMVAGSLSIFATTVFMLIGLPGFFYDLFTSEHIPYYWIVIALLWPPLTKFGMYLMSQVHVMKSRYKDDVIGYFDPDEEYSTPSNWITTIITLAFFVPSVIVLKFVSGGLFACFSTLSVIYAFILIFTVIKNLGMAPVPGMMGRLPDLEKKDQDKKH